MEYDAKRYRLIEDAHFGIRRKTDKTVVKTFSCFEDFIALQNFFQLEIQIMLC